MLILLRDNPATIVEDLQGNFIHKTKSWAFEDNENWPLAFEILGMVQTLCNAHLTQVFRQHGWTLWSRPNAQCHVIRQSGTRQSQGCSKKTHSPRTLP
jgi:hypothetical protein